MIEYIDYKAIYDCLVRIKHGNRYPQYGICINLLLALKQAHMSQTFMNHALKAKYGKYDPYLIEGNTETHRSVQDKFDTSHQYGKARMELLNYLIKYAAERVDK